MPSVSKTASKERGVLRVSVPEQEPPPTEPAVDREVGGLLGDPSGVRMGHGPGDVDSPGGELEEEQHVQPLQRDGLDGKEINREHAIGLRPQKGMPRETGALAGRAEARLPQDLPHRRRRNLKLETVQLTDIR